MAKQIKHLTRAEKRKLIIDRLKIAPELSDRAIARMVGVSPTTVGTLRREFTDKTVQNGQVDTSDYDWTQHEYLRQNPDLLIGMSEASLRAIKVEGVLSLMQQRNSRSPRYCQRLLYEERKKANKSPAITVTEDDVEIFVGDIRTGLPQIKDESVDLIFTDPPYNYQAVSELYHHIASVAGRVLVDGGSLAVMCGGTFLDVALRELSTDKRLKFNWNIAYVTPRGTPLVHSRKVATAVKHILWFVKGGKYEGKIVYDLIEVPPDPENADKIPHIWGQSIQGVQEVLRRLSTGGVVCDVMCGGGSTVVAALELGGRKVIACDIDEEAVKTTKTRVRRLFGHTK